MIRADPLCNLVQTRFSVSPGGTCSNPHSHCTRQISPENVAMFVFHRRLKSQLFSIFCPPTISILPPFLPPHFFCASWLTDRESADRYGVFRRTCGNWLYRHGGGARAQVRSCICLPFSFDLWIKNVALARFFMWKMFMFWERCVAHLEIATTVAPTGWRTHAGEQQQYSRLSRGWVGVARFCTWMGKTAVLRYCAISARTRM